MFETLFSSSSFQYSLEAQSVLYLFLGILAMIFSLGFAMVLSFKITKREVKKDASHAVWLAIKKGAEAFLRREYKALFIVVLVVAFLLLFLDVRISITFLTGAFLSALSGNIGMRIATASNVRTFQALKKDLSGGLGIAFSSGLVMAMSVVGLGLLGIISLFLLFGDPRVLFGFGFGASLVALFARVGGGIYTKAADVGADLVGKVEKGIPEDDPRNPAVIADNVGDNVGDVAGMGADLFESYVDAIIAAMVIGYLGAIAGEAAFSDMLLPVAIAALGVGAAIVGSLVVFLFKRLKNPSMVLNAGIWSAGALLLIMVFSFFVFTGERFSLFWSFVAGLLGGVIIGLITEYYTSSHARPTREVALASETGPATNIITGMSLAMKSTFIPVLVVVGVMYVGFELAGIFGVAISAVGMLSTLGITLAADTYGPVVDNAAGIAQMSGARPIVRKRAEKLDAVGNTTAAIGKGFAIGAAALTALVLLVTYGKIVGLSVVNLLDVKVLIGVFLGGLVPFIFSSLTLSSVGTAAIEMVKEVRRQFKEIKGLLKGKAEPDYERAVDISARAAIREMFLPSMLAVAAPVAIGLLLGKAALAGFLGGSIVTGFLLAVFMANAGGAWDNAKKYIEEGHLGGKGSDAHKASVVGDTVGDPLKDTSGPSLNILIKLMAIISLIIAPLL